MNFKKLIINETDPETNEPIWEKITDRVYFNKAYVKDPVTGQYRYFTIQEIMKKIGAEQHYNKLIEDCVYRTKNNGSDRLMLVQTDMHPREYIVEPQHQKLLYFWLGTPEGNCIINGGILFWFGEMSYHT